MYKFVAAGCLFNFLRNRWLYVTYEKNDPNNIKLEAYKEPRCLIARCPDRTLIFSSFYRPRPDCIDEAICIDPYKPGNVLEPYLDYTLMSAFAARDSLSQTRADLYTDRVTILGDSGGAQIKLGVTNYLDPADIIEWMNKVPDLAISLDIPPRPSDQHIPKVVSALALIQKHNNEVYKQKARPNLRMINAIHGFTLDEQRNWADTVADPAFYGWASAANNYKSLLAEIRCAILPMIEYKECSPNHYHVFGVSGKLMYPVLAWMGRYHPNVTSDSSTWIHCGSITRRMEVLMPDTYGTWDLDGNPVLAGEWGASMMNVGFQRSKIGGEHHILPCSCPICSRVKYLELFRMKTGARLGHWLAAHNLIMTQIQVKFWNDMAQRLDYDKYIKLVKALVPPHAASGSPDTQISAINYMEGAFAHGLDYVERQNKSWMGDDSSAGLGMEVTFESEENAGQKASFSGILNLHSNLYDTLGRYLTKQEIEGFGLTYYDPSVMEQRKETKIIVKKDKLENELNELWG